MIVVCLSWQTTIIHYHRFVMELLQWHKVCEHGGDKLHRPPVVALIVCLPGHFTCFSPWNLYNTFHAFHVLVNINWFKDK